MTRPSDNGQLTDHRRWELALHEGSFEEALAALEEVVAALEAGQLSLEATLDHYALGVRLVTRCEGDLDAAELRVSTLGTVPAPAQDTSDLDDVPF
jgi:exodeoxyribonuclease VII small subunit